MAVSRAGNGKLPAQDGCGISPVANAFPPRLLPPSADGGLGAGEQLET